MTKIEAESLYRYELATSSFESLEDAGMWVSKTTVQPIQRTQIDDLPNRLQKDNVELRILDVLTLCVMCEAVVYMLAESAFATLADEVLEAATRSARGRCRSVLVRERLLSGHEVELPICAHFSAQPRSPTVTLHNLTRQESEAKPLMSNLATVGHGVAELRGLYGTGMGSMGQPPDLPLATLIETHERTFWFAFWGIAASDAEFAREQRRQMQVSRAQIEDRLREELGISQADAKRAARLFLTMMMGLAVEICFDVKRNVSDAEVRSLVKDTVTAFFPAINTTRKKPRRG